MLAMTRSPHSTSSCVPLLSRSRYVSGMDLSLFGKPCCRDPHLPSLFDRGLRVLERIGVPVSIESRRRGRNRQMPPVLNGFLGRTSRSHDQTDGANRERGGPHLNQGRVLVDEDKRHQSPISPSSRAFARTSSTVP